MSKVDRKRENCEGIVHKQKRRRYENGPQDTNPFPFLARSTLFLFYEVFLHTLGLSITEVEERDGVTETFS